MGGMMVTMMECTGMDIIPSQPLVAAIDPGHSKEAIVEATAEPMNLHFIEPRTSEGINDNTDAHAGHGVLTGNDQNDLGPIQI